MKSPVTSRKARTFPILKYPLKNLSIVLLFETNITRFQATTSGGEKKNTLSTSRTTRIKNSYRNATLNRTSKHITKNPPIAAKIIAIPKGKNKTVKR